VEFNPTTMAVLLVVALVLGVAGVIAAAAALHGQRKVRRAYRTFSLGSRDDVLTLLERHLNEVRHLRGEVADLRRYADELRAFDRETISRIGTVRFDAFEDMGGRLSFSMALLDEGGDGVVVTAINGRTDTRVYAKPVAGGTSRHNLSEEEAAAIQQAIQDSPLNANATISPAEPHIVQLGTGVSFTIGSTPLIPQGNVPSPA
jgi:hypothetical protein